MDDCQEIMTLGLVDVSYMLIFNDFDETDRDEFHGRITDAFSMIMVVLLQLKTMKVLWVLVLVIWGVIPGLIQPCTLAK